MAPIPGQFSNVWVVAVAVQAKPGERLIPIVVAAKAVGTDCIVEMVGPIQYIHRSPPLSD